MTSQTGATQLPSTVPSVVLCTSATVQLYPGKRTAGLEECPTPPGQVGLLQTFSLTAPSIS